ncbi:hypothetical protein [Aeoliella sp.]|uniref:hypothetical protein n=1 Tax=Aeoliella sp. TaxID=2795800 RepID=UPI003CCC0789
MDKLLTQVRRAHRRLLVEKFLHYLVWSAFIALAVAAVAIAAPQLVAIDNLPANWTQVWLWLAGGGCVLGALIATYVTRQSTLDAAIEIDRRYQLRERVASSLALSPTDLDSQAGQALLKDASHRIDRIDIGEKFRPHMDRRAWLPLVPAVIVFCLITFGSNKEALSSVEPTPTNAARAKVKKANEELQKKLQDMKKKAEQKDLKEAEELLKELEQETKELNKDNPEERKKTTVKLNNLAKQLEERRAKLGTSESLKKQMENMKELSQGPADKMAKAMQQGDWKKAIDELKQLQDKIGKDNLTKSEKDKLDKQLDQLKKKLADATQANREAMNQLKKQIEEQRKKGDLAKAGELQQKLDQMQQNQPQMQNLDKLAQKLGQCQNCMKAGDKEGAARAMSELADQLQQMQQQGQELEMLDEALAQLEAAKNAMNGMNMDQAFQDGMGGMGDQFNEQGGMGMGAGRGYGPRPDEENPTQFRDTQVRQNPGQGAATFGGFVDGPNVAGQTGIAAEQELEGINAEPADPLTSQRLPRAHGQHAEEYFKQLRE